MLFVNITRRQSRYHSVFPVRTIQIIQFIHLYSWAEVFVLFVVKTKWRFNKISWDFQLVVGTVVDSISLNMFSISERPGDTHTHPNVLQVDKTCPDTVKCIVECPTEYTLTKADQSVCPLCTCDTSLPGEYGGNFLSLSTYNEINTKKKIMQVWHMRLVRYYSVHSAGLN